MKRKIVVLGGGISGYGSAILAKKKGLFETKIMMRFFIISLLLSALTLVTLKIQ